MTPVPPSVQSTFQWPNALTLEPYQTLQRDQVLKVAAVALACLALFGIQLACPWTLATGVALTCSVITLISEAFLRSDSAHNISWTHSNINMKKFAFHVAIYLLVFPMILALTTAPGVILPQAMILAGNVKVTPLVTLFAPVVEEIFFRGFLQERLEDLGTLVDRYICPLSKGTGQRLSVVVQSLLFGAAHITGMQATCGAKMRLFCMASIFGFWQAQSKNKYQSLLAPIALHFARNAGTTVRRWLASALFPGGCEAKLLN